MNRDRASSSALPQTHLEYHAAGVCVPGADTTAVLLGDDSGDVEAEAQVALAGALAPGAHGGEQLLRGGIRGELRTAIRDAESGFVVVALESKSYHAAVREIVGIVEELVEKLLDPPA